MTAEIAMRTPALRLVRQLAQTPVARIYPRIVLESCAYCAGTGRTRALIGGRWVERGCSYCNSRGTVARDS